MNNSSTLAPLAAVPPVGGDELAEGLMLVRASALKVIRLQLAMERGDRRVALEAVDDLMALDRRLQGYLADLPASDDYALFKDELEAERSALNIEKLTLGAGVSGRGGPAETPTRETPPPDREFDQVPVGNDLAPEPLGDWRDGSPDAPGEGYAPHRHGAWVVGLLLLVSAVAVVAGVLGGFDVDHWLRQLAVLQ